MDPHPWGGTILAGVMVTGGLGEVHREVRKGVQFQRKEQGRNSFRLKHRQRSQGCLGGGADHWGDFTFFRIVCFPFFHTEELEEGPGCHCLGALGRKLGGSASPEGHKNSSRGSGERAGRTPGGVTG